MVVYLLAFQYYDYNEISYFKSLILKSLSNLLASHNLKSQ